MCRCSCRRLTDEQMCPTEVTGSLQRLRKRRKTVPVWTAVFILLVTLWSNVNVVSGVCVWQGGGSFRLACGFRQSGLFRIRSLGGLKGYVGAGFTVGDEDGFKDSMTNTEGKTPQQQQLQQQQLQGQGQYYGQQQRISTGHHNHVNFPHQLQGQYSDMNLEKVNGNDYLRSNPNSQISHNVNGNVNQLSTSEVLSLQQQQTELLLLQQLQQQQMEMKQHQEQAKAALPAGQLMVPTPTSSPHNDDPSRNGLTKRASLWRWPKLPIFGGNNKQNGPHHPRPPKMGRGPQNGPHSLRRPPPNRGKQHHQPQQNHYGHQQNQIGQQQNPQKQLHAPQRGPGPRTPNSHRIPSPSGGEQYHNPKNGGRPRPGNQPQRGQGYQGQGPVNYRRGPAASYSNNVNSVVQNIPGPIPLPPKQKHISSQYSSMSMKRPNHNEYGFGEDEGNPLPDFKGIPKEYFDAQPVDYNEGDGNAPEEEQQYLDADGKPYGLKMLQNTHNYGSAYQLLDSQPKVPPYLIEEAGSENVPNSYDNTQGDPGFGVLSGYDMNDPALATAGYDPNIFPDIYFTTTEKENDRQLHRVLSDHFADPVAHLQEPSVIEQEPETVIEEAVVEKPKIKRIRIIKGGKRRKKKRRRKFRVDNSTLNAIYNDEVTESDAHAQASEQVTEESPTTPKQVSTTSAETKASEKPSSTEVTRPRKGPSSMEILEPPPSSLPLTSTSPDYGPNFVDERYLPFNIESYYYEESKNEVPPPPPPPTNPPTRYKNDWLTRTDDNDNSIRKTNDPSDGYDPRYPPNHEVNRGKIPSKFLRSTTTTTTPRPFFTEDTHYNPSTHFNKTRFANRINQVPVTERSDALQFVPFGSGENANTYDQTRLYNDKFYSASSHFNKTITPITGNFYSNPGYYNPQFSVDMGNSKFKGINTSPRPFGPPEDFNPDDIILPWEKKSPEPTPIIMNLNGGKNRLRRPPGPVFPGSNTMDIDKDPGFVKPNLNLDILNSPTMETFGLPSTATQTPRPRFRYPDESEERSDTFTINELRKLNSNNNNNNNNGNSESDTPNFWGKIQELDRFGPSADFVTNDNFKIPMDRVLSTEAPPQPPTTPSPILSTTPGGSVKWTKSRRRMRTRPTTTTTTEMPPPEPPRNAATMVPPLNSPSPWNNFEDNGQVFSGLGLQVSSKDVPIAQSVSDEGLWAGEAQKTPILTTNEDKTVFRLHNSDHQENMYVGNVMSSTTLAPPTNPPGDAVKKTKWRRRKPGSRPNVRIKFKGASAEQQEQEKNSAEQNEEKDVENFSPNFFDVNSVTSENSVDSVNNPNPFAKFENVEVHSGSGNSGEGFVSKNELMDIASTIKKLTKQNKKKFSQNVNADSSEEKTQGGEDSISPAPKIPSMANIVPSPPDPFQYGNNQGSRFNFPSQSFAPPQPPPSPSQSIFNKPWGIPSVKYEIPSFHSTTSSSFSFPRKNVDLNTIDYSTSTENSRQIKVEDENHLEYPRRENPNHGGMGDFSLHDEIDSLNQELEDLIAVRSTTRRPMDHHFNNNYKDLTFPDALPVQNMFPPPPPPPRPSSTAAPPPPFAMNPGPSIKIIKPNTQGDTRGSGSDPTIYKKTVPSQNSGGGGTTPTPPKPTVPPQKNQIKNQFSTYSSPGNHFDGTKYKQNVNGNNNANSNSNSGNDNDNNKNNNIKFPSSSDKEKTAVNNDQQKEKEKKPSSSDSNNGNSIQFQQSPSNFNPGHFRQSSLNFKGNNYGNQVSLSTMASILANNHMRYAGGKVYQMGSSFSGKDILQNVNQIYNNGNNYASNFNNNKNENNFNNNKNENNFNNNNNNGNNFNNNNNNGNNFNNNNNNGNNFNHNNNNGNNFNNNNNGNNFNHNNGNNVKNNENHFNNNGNNFNNNGNNFNNNGNNFNSNGNTIPNGENNNVQNNGNNFNSNGNNIPKGVNNNMQHNGNNNYAASSANYFSRPGQGPGPTQIPHQTFQPPMPMPPSGMPTMGSLLAPFSNMLTNTFGIGKHKPPPNMPPMMPPMMNPQQQLPPQQRPHLPPPPATKFPPPNKFNNINYHNNRFPPPPPPMNNNQFNHPFQKPPHQSYRDGPQGPPHHPFNRPTLMDGDPMHMVEQQSHSQMKNVPPMLPMPLPRRPSPPQPPSPPKKKPMNDKEKIIEALETLNNVKYDEIESVAAEQFGPDLIERIKSKKKFSVSSTTPRPTTRVPSSTTPRPTTTQRPIFVSSTLKTPSASESTVQLASLISYVNKMKKEHEKMKNINQAMADAHSSESKHHYTKHQNPIASMSTDDISSLFASISSGERGSKTAVKHHSTTTTPKPKLTTVKPSLELPVFGPTSGSLSFGPSGGDGNDIKTLQSQLAKAILAKAARQQETKVSNSSPSPTAPQKLVGLPSHNPLQAVVHLASVKGNHLGINSKNYTSAQIETLKKLIALNNIEKKLMQSHGFFNLSSGILGRGPQQSPWRPPQQPTPFHNKMLLDQSSNPSVNNNHLQLSSNSPVQNNPFSASANNNYNSNNKVASHIKIVNSNSNSNFNNQFQNNFAAPVPSPSDPTLIALKALAMKKAQGINPQPNILLPQQTKPKEEKSPEGFQPIPVDLSAILSPSPPLEIVQPEGTNWQRRTRLTDIKNAPKSFYPGNASLEFEAASTTQMFTDFSCDDQKFFPGLYADTALSCKVFHLCAKTNTGYMMKTFRCPRETVFDQEVLRCNWNLYVDCNVSQDKYHFNKYLSQSFQFLRILGEFSASYQKPNATVTG